MKTYALILFTCVLVSTSLGQSTFVVLDKSEKNIKAVAAYDRDVRRRIDFSTLRSAINDFIASQKTISVGSENDRYTVDLQLHQLKDDWHLVDLYEAVYVSGQWYWRESENRVTVWFNDHSVCLTLTFKFTARNKCKKTDEAIDDRRYIIE